MSLKSKLLKIAIKWTPRKLILWVANIILKDIAEVTHLSFDLEPRKAYVEIQLVGESETIEVWLEDFAIITEEESYKFIIKNAKSNRIWLDNILSRVIKKAWKIPVTAQMTSQIDVLAELLKSENSVENNS